ncbi:MAG: ATP-binding cassette domain-containing protein, partial [Treponema sp.]|nr:ATP-binding cassette domain-containing protein [Treponema sp.]
MVELRGIRKRFSANGVLALDGAGFSARPGEIHALLGENGAGKSTLMHIMAGFLNPDRGGILMKGKEARFSSPADALAAGIGMVRQHPNLIRGFKVWEDCVTGAEPRRGGILRPKAARNRAAELSKRWGFGLDVDAVTSSLTVSQRQKAAVLALLIREAEYLIFDEPTAVLSPGETQGLFALFRALRDGGKGVILISHKLEETLALAGWITVLGKGKTLASGEAASFSGDSLQALMFGSLEEKPVSARPARAKKRTSPGAGNKPPVLSVQNLGLEIPGRPFIRGACLDVAPGAILGVAGVRDSGLETLELG